MFTKEDYMAAVVEHEKPQHLPSAMSGLVVMTGGALETFENGPFGGGPDGFGVIWEASQSADKLYLHRDMLSWRTSLPGRMW